MRLARCEASEASCASARLRRPLIKTRCDRSPTPSAQIRTSREPNCPFETGYRVTVACIMAVESYRLGRTVSWNAETEEIV